MSLVESVHEGYVRSRRVRVLGDHIAALLPQGAKILDVGAGDGQLAALVRERRPDVDIAGIDLIVRPETAIPVTRFDGRTIPHPDRSFDVVLFVDVLHHADDARALLGEGVRVARRAVVVKDHLREGWLAGRTLQFMDRIGNERHGVPTTGHYWTADAWAQAVRDLGVFPTVMKRSLGIYPWPLDLVFGRSLHFVARLERPQAA